MDIDYEAIGRGIKDVLDGALQAQYLSGVKVEWDPVEIGVGNAPEVGIWWAGDELQEVEIGSPEPYEAGVNFRLLCGVTGPTFAESRAALYALVNRVRAALHADRTLKGTVGVSTVVKVEPETYEQSGFWSAANITLNARMAA